MQQEVIIMSLFNPDISTDPLTQDYSDDTDPTLHFSDRTSLEEASFEQKPTPLFNSASAGSIEEPLTSYNSPLFPQPNLETQEMSNAVTSTEKVISSSEADKPKITPSIPIKMESSPYEIEKLIKLISVHSAENKSATSIIIDTLNSVGINLDALLEDADLKEEETKVNIQKIMREIQFFEEQMNERNEQIILLRETLERFQSIKYEIKNSALLKR